MRRAGGHDGVAAASWRGELRRRAGDAPAPSSDEAAWFVVEVQTSGRAAEVLRPLSSFVACERLLRRARARDGGRLPVKRMRACAEGGALVPCAHELRRRTRLIDQINAWLAEAGAAAAADAPEGRLRGLWANFTSPLVADGIVSARRRAARGADGGELELELRARRLSQFFTGDAEGELMARLATEAMAAAAGPVVFLEPSAGAGDIVRHLARAIATGARAARVIGIDVDARLAAAHGWVCADFLRLRGAADVAGMEGVPRRNACVVTNPPFNSNKAADRGGDDDGGDSLALEFVRHAFSFADTVVFLLPKRYASIEDWDGAVGGAAPDGGGRPRAIDFRRATPVISAGFQFCGARVVQPVFVGVLTRRGAHDDAVAAR